MGANALLRPSNLAAIAVLVISINKESVGKIHQLESSVIDQIAAGEVVERPSHMLKELIENSLDAEAQKIIIEITDGGRSVKVTDDGIGMESEDLQRCLSRHSTSKIQNSEDLWKLKTFGFRGEALSSISSVSKVRLKTRTQDADSGFQLDSDFGSQSNIKSTSTVPGTVVEINNLFENVPARLKFLKSASAEIQQMKQVIKATALSHPEVEFKLLIEGRLEYFWKSAESRSERVKQVLDLQQPITLTHSEQGIKIEAVIAEPRFAAKTSKNIWLFAQNRWIQDKSLMAAIFEGFRTFLMQGEYPQCVVWIEVDPESIDVNVHPTKSVVKFQDPQAVFRRLYHLISSHLRSPKADNTDRKIQQNKAESFVPGEPKPVESHQQMDWGINDTQIKKVSFQAFNSDPKNNVSAHFDIRSLEELRPNATPDKVNSESNVDGEFWSKLQVIGQVHLTYILAQSAEKMFLIDQHAAHERVGYEKLWQGWRLQNMESQQLLMPIVVDLDTGDCEVLAEHQKSFNRLGLFFEILGPSSLAVTAIPSLLFDGIVPKVMAEAVEKIKSFGVSFEFEKTLSEIFATMSCHSVIRAGHSMSLQEMQALLKEMDRFQGSSYCPHGRPVWIEWDFNFIEKEFGRKL